MKRSFQSVCVLVLSCLVIAGCATTNKRAEKHQKLLNTPADSMILPMDYIDAFANAKHNYEKCVAKASFQTPIYVNSMGTTIQTMTTIPGTYVKTDLDRQAALAVIDIDTGDKPSSVLHFRPYGENQTQLTIYQATKSAKVRQKFLTNAQAYASSQFDRCP